jgi:hypothetical protein
MVWLALGLCLVVVPAERPAIAAPAELSVVVVDGLVDPVIGVALQLSGSVSVFGPGAAGLRVDPPLGQPLAAGAPVLQAADGSTPTTGDHCGGLRSGQIDVVIEVLQVQIVNGAVERFAARTRARCGDGTLDQRLVAYRATVPIAAIGVPNSTNHLTPISVVARLGGESTTQPITLTNVGSVPLRPSALVPVVDGPPSGLSFDAAGCRPEVLPGDTCTIAMRWEPQVRGVWQGRIRIASTASNWFDPLDATSLAVAYAIVGAPAPPPGDALRPIDPVRLLDTRFGTGAPVGASAQVPLRLQIAGRDGIPSNATAVMANLTVTEPTAAGYVSAWPGGTERPVVSNLNFSPRDTVANTSMLRLGDDGSVELFVSSGTAHLIVDVVAYLSPFAPYVFQPETYPRRLVDTRSGLGSPRTPLGPGETRVFEVEGIPPIARAAVVNLTGVSPTKPTHLTAFGSAPGIGAPLASTVNLRAGEVRPNLAIVSLEDGRRLTVFNNSGDTHVVIDLLGWFQQGGDESTRGRIVPLEPFRVVDSREADDPIGPFEAGGYLFPGTLDGLTVASLVFNATVTEPTHPGYLTMFPGDSITLPTASNLNFVGGQTVPNQVWVRLPRAPSNLIGILNGSPGGLHVVLDLQAVVLG